MSEILIFGHPVVLTISEITVNVTVADIFVIIIKMAVRNKPLVIADFVADNDLEFLAIRENKMEIWMS